MLPMPALPSSLLAILSLLSPAFTAPTFQTFRALVVGFVGRVGEHTVWGMWQEARLGGRLHISKRGETQGGKRLKRRRHQPLPQQGRALPAVLRVRSKCAAQPRHRLVGV